MTKLKAALIGAGFIGPVHLEALRRLGVGVTGVLSGTPESSRRAARALGLPRAYGTFAEVLADPEAQVLHLASPNRDHFVQAAAALQAGKHVMCEKPLAMNSRESAALLALAHRTGRVGGVGYNVRFNPLCLEARERVRQGELGRVFSVTGSYTQDWLLYPTDYNWRVLADQGGPLRAVGDIGTHWLDLVSFITGLEVEAVCADLATVHPVRRRPRGEIQTFSGKLGRAAATEPVPIATEDSGAVLLRFAGGAHGCLWVSQVTPGRKNCVRFEIAGAQSTLAWNSEKPNTMWVGHRERANELLLRDPALASPAVRPFISLPGGHNEGHHDTFKHLFRAFYDYLDAGDFRAPPNFPTFADGHREILLGEAILKSHRCRRWVTLELGQAGDPAKKTRRRSRPGGGSGISYP